MYVYVCRTMSVPKTGYRQIYMYTCVCAAPTCIHFTCIHFVGMFTFHIHSMFTFHIHTFCGMYACSIKENISILSFHLPSFLNMKNALMKLPTKYSKMHMTCIYRNIHLYRYVCVCVYIRIYIYESTIVLQRGMCTCVCIFFVLRRGGVHACVCVRERVDVSVCAISGSGKEFRIIYAIYICDTAIHMYCISIAYMYLCIACMCCICIAYMYLCIAYTYVLHMYCIHVLHVYCIYMLHICVAYVLHICIYVLHICIAYVLHIRIAYMYLCIACMCCICIAYMYLCIAYKYVLHRYRI